MADVHRLTRTKLSALVPLLATLAIHPVAAQDQDTEAETGNESFWSQFKDPDDGMFDMSQWLLENIVGFMPIPVIITEPAVDDGLGLAGVFFHKLKEDQMKPIDSGNLILPNVSAIAVAYTGNDSKFIGGGHFRNWDKDHYRYNGLGGYGDINLTSYGDDNFPLLADGVGFNIETGVLSQEILARIKGSNWFVGADWTYVRSDVTFATGSMATLPTTENTVSGLSVVGLFENVDYQISPRQGLSLNLEAQVNNDAIGSDYDFEKYTWKIRQYFEIGDKYTLAWRLDGATTSGDVPFYLKPYVTIQGIPALRYQGSSAATAEVRAGYDLRPRWTIHGFVGGGRAADTISDLGSASTRTAYGTGFRYLVAKALGIRVGIDVARGPEETYLYLVMGSSWL